MSDEPGELQRRLELITSRNCPPGAPLDGESAALRAAWLRFGKLLEAAQAAGEGPARVSVIPRVPRWRKRLLASLGVLAACLLIAVAADRYLRVAPPPTALPAGPLSGGLSASGSQPFAAPAGHQARATPSPKAEVKWDDPLDREIELTARAAVQAEQDEVASAAGSSLIQYQLEKLGRGVEAGSF